MIQSVSKAFRVLQAFDAGHPLMTLSELARRTGLDLSATQRFCHTLHKLGYLTKDPVTRQFGLSLRVLDLSHQYKRASQLVNRAMPVLQHLARETEETVNLTVLDDTEVVYVSRIQSRHVLNPHVISGTRLPAFCVSPGRAILSGLPQAHVADVIARSELRPHTPATITDPDRLIAVIARCRDQGYAACFEEWHHGDASLAAPIPGPGGQVLGAIGIASSLARFSREELVEAYASMIIAAARSIVA